MKRKKQKQIRVSWIKVSHTTHTATELCWILGVHDSLYYTSTAMCMYLVICHI